jgi:hypothetical protein
MSPMRHLTVSPASFAWGTASSVAVLLSIGLALQDVRLAKAVTSAASDNNLPVSSVSMSGMGGNTAPPSRADTLDTPWNFPRGEDPDAPFRSVGLLANEQGVTVTHMQRKVISTSSRALAHVQYDLQLRGNYVAIKSVLIGMLQKFPGLVIQRLAFRSERADGPGAAGAEDVGGTVELIQYLSPVSDR